MISVSFSQVHKKVISRSSPGSVKARQVRLARYRGFFMREQPCFPGEAAAITGEAGVGADDPMAGYDDRDWIGAVGEAHRTARARPADRGGERAGAQCPARGGAAERPEREGAGGGEG